MSKKTKKKNREEKVMVITWEEIVGAFSKLFHSEVSAGEFVTVTHEDGRVQIKFKLTVKKALTYTVDFVDDGFIAIDGVFTADLMKATASFIEMLTPLVIANFNNLISQLEEKEKEEEKTEGEA